MANGKQYGAERKAKIIIEALEGERTISEIEDLRNNLSED